MITTDPTVVHRACDLGVNCFATSRDYQKGNNEAFLGSALRGRRDEVVLCTETIDMMWRPKTEKETADYVLRNLETSLRDLQTDHVDLFFLHHKDEPGWIPDEAVEAVRAAKKQGKLRHAGITTHALPKMAGYLAASDLFEVVVPIYNFTVDEETRAAVRKVHDAGIGVVAMKVMAGGLRSEKPLAQLRRPGALAAALRWVLDDAGVDAALTSVASFEELEDNVRAASAPFTDADRRTLAAALDEFGPTYCRMCGRCEGTCAKGLPIPEILRCGMYAEGYGQPALGRDKFRALPDEARRPACGDCTSCSVRCAYGLAVAERVLLSQTRLA
jgi:aryl-alcohol dehydrogenase-like predicted oxidoreductase